MDIKRIPHSPNKTFTKKIPMPLPDYILICIALLSALMYMVLFLFGSIPIYAIALLISVWLFYWLKSCHLSFVTPLNYPIICLLIVASLGLFISTDLALFLPKMAGLIIGVSTFFVIVNFFRFRQRLTPVIFLLLFLALAISFLAFLGTEWTEDGIGFINQFYSKLPNFPFFNEREGINKNTMGGALTFFPPLLLSLLWDGGAFSRFKSRYPRFTNIPDLVYKFLVLLILVLVLLALLLTQSRGAWLGCVAGAILFLVLKNKHFLWTIPLLIVTFLFFLFTFADGNLVELLSILDTSQEATLPDRLEIWQKAFYIFRDFPLSGISLGSFGDIYRNYFSSISFPMEADVIFHPHNTLLSVAVEVGLPGFILYTSLLGGFAAMSWETLKTTRTLNRVILIGLVSGMAAFLVYGLFDAFTLGRKLEIIFWIYLGIVSAMFVHENALNSTKASQAAVISEKNAEMLDSTLIKHNFRHVLLKISVWILLAVFSLCWVNINIVAAFLIALASGLLFGVGQTTSHNRISLSVQ